MGDDTPYDAAGWTLPYQMDVDVVEGQSPLPTELRAALQPVQGQADAWGASPDFPLTTNAEAAGIVPTPGGLTGSGTRHRARPGAGQLVPADQSRARQGRVAALPAGDVRARRPLSAVTASTLVRQASGRRSCGSRAERTGGRETAGAVNAPTRLALYKAAPGNMDEGWTEWLLDTQGFKYTLLTPDSLQAGQPRRALRRDPLRIAGPDERARRTRRTRRRRVRWSRRPRRRGSRQRGGGGRGGRQCARFVPWRSSCAAGAPSSSGTRGRPRPSARCNSRCATSWPACPAGTTSPAGRS